VRRCKPTKIQGKLVQLRKLRQQIERELEQARALEEAGGFGPLAGIRLMERQLDQQRNAAQAKAARERLERELAGLDKKLNLDSDPSHVTSPAEPGEWRGTKRALARWIRDGYAQGGLKANNLLHALQIGAQHFVWKDPQNPDKPAERFKPRSLQQNISNEYAHIKNIKKSEPR
jgi:hypothetical protein